MMTSPMCQMSTPIRVQPVMVLSFLPKLACMCRAGLPVSSVKIVPMPHASCTPQRRVVMGCGGMVLPSFGPVTILLLSCAPPRKRHMAFLICFCVANVSMVWFSGSLCCSLRMNVLVRVACV